MQLLPRSIVATVACNTDFVMASSSSLILSGSEAVDHLFVSRVSFTPQGRLFV